MAVPGHCCYPLLTLFSTIARLASVLSKLWPSLFANSAKMSSGNPGESNEGSKFHTLSIVASGEFGSQKRPNPVPYAPVLGYLSGDSIFTAMASPPSTTTTTTKTTPQQWRQPHHFPRLGGTGVSALVLREIDNHCYHLSSAVWFRRRLQKVLRGEFSARDRRQNAIRQMLAAVQQRKKAAKNRGKWRWIVPGFWHGRMQVVKSK